MAILILIVIILVMLIVTHKFSNKSEGFGRMWNNGTRYYPTRYYPMYSQPYGRYPYDRYPAYTSYLNDYYYTPCYQTVFGYTLCDY